MADMVDHMMPLLKYVKNFILKNKWPSIDRVKNITVPILFMISEHDELIPYNHMEKLYKFAVNSRFKHKVKNIKISMLY
jgi:pimeloyl-ACP methyl ester carboxylesterase